MAIPRGRTTRDMPAPVVGALLPPTTISKVRPLRAFNCNCASAATLQQLVARCAAHEPDLKARLLSLVPRDIATVGLKDHELEALGVSGWPEAVDTFIDCAALPDGRISGCTYHTVVVTDSALQHCQPKEQFHAALRRFDASGGRVVVLATEGLFALPFDPNSVFDRKWTFKSDTSFRFGLTSAGAVHLDGSAGEEGKVLLAPMPLSFPDVYGYFQDGDDPDAGPDGGGRYYSPMSTITRVLHRRSTMYSFLCLANTERSITSGKIPVLTPTDCTQHLADMWNMFDDDTKLQYAYVTAAATPSTTATSSVTSSVTTVTTSTTSSMSTFGPTTPTTSDTSSAA